MACVSISVFALQSSKTAQDQQVSQATAEQLQRENEEMKQEIAEMKEALQKNPEVVEKKIDNYLDHWINVLAIVMAILGIAMPLIISIQNERNMERQVEEAAKKAESANAKVSEMLKLSATIDGIKQQIDKSNEEIRGSKDEIRRIKQEIKQDKKETEKYAQETENSVYDYLISNYFFNQNDKSDDYYSIFLNYNSDKSIDYIYKSLFFFTRDDFDRSISEINKAIKKSPSDHRNYLVRGVIYMSNRKYNEAISDFTLVIGLKPESKYSYLFRAECYRKLAENEEDPAKKAEYLKKAQDDKNEANKL